PRPLGGLSLATLDFPRLRPCLDASALCRYMLSTPNAGVSGTAMSTGKNMIDRRARWAAAFALALLLAALAGCVERQMIITTEPGVAVVFDEQGIGLSQTPADRSF